jgi:acylphosphatase
LLPPRAEVQGRAAEKTITVRRRGPGADVMAKQIHCLVRGRVQGVFFRTSTQREAKRLGLTGWVKNLADGTVEVVAEGEDDSLKEFVGWLQRGPTAARVERVDSRWRGYTGDWGDFRIVE